MGQLIVILFDRWPALYIPRRRVNAVNLGYSGFYLPHTNENKMRP